MATLESIRKPIETELTEFDDFVRRQFASADPLLGEMLDYVLSARGKGIRPTLVLLSAAMNSSEGIRPGKRSLLAALLVEMIHITSLIHDDVIDESDMRRGQASVNARWQSRNAVLLGDYILARNIDIGLSSGQFDIVSHVVGSLAVMCEGEILQGALAERQTSSREEYFDVIYKKTACLMGASASAGAMSAGAASDRVALMRRFGEALGIAFQIQDDILDYTRNAQTGKPANNDLREHKITLPLLAVLERLSEERRRELLDELALCHQDEAHVERIQREVERGGGIAAAADIMRAYISKAVSMLARYEDSPFRRSLIDLCYYVANRDR